MSTACHFSPVSQDPGSVYAPLGDGSLAALRPLGPGEEGPLDDVFDGLSPASRSDRYLVGVHRLTRAMRLALTNIDGHRHVAWVASVEGRPVGIARAVRFDPLTAEVAFEVVDDMQGKGVGAVLLDSVTTVAAARGVEQIRASVLPSNHRSLRLLAKIGLRLHPSDGLLEGQARLRLMRPARIDRQAVVRLALGGPGSRAAAQASATLWSNPPDSAH
jgi:RimJ/RimL family protein N-acetyltransferase